MRSISFTGLQLTANEHVIAFQPPKLTSTGNADVSNPFASSSTLTIELMQAITPTEQKVRLT